MREKIKAGGGRRTIRCAIYTRKSTDEGLEQGFNSLHAQREAREAYVTSQRHEGWTLIKTVYNDGSYSGGSMERPGLQRLLADIQSGQRSAGYAGCCEPLAGELPCLDMDKRTRIRAIDDKP